MNRGEIYLVRKSASSDPRRQRAFVIVNRQVLIDSPYESVVCAPVYSKYLGLDSQVEVGTAEGLKHNSAIHCDGLMSVTKTRLTDFLGSLGRDKLLELDLALKVALAIE